MPAEFFEPLTKSIIDGNAEEAVILTKRAIASGLSGNEILQKGLIPGINTVGRRFAEGEYYLPELLMSGESHGRCRENS